MGDRIRVGQSYTFDIPVDDGATPIPNPVDPTTLSVVARDNLTGTATVTHAIGQLTRVQLGLYRDVLTLPAGSYTIEVTTTNPAGNDTDWLDVVAITPPVINLRDAKAQLDKSTARRANDAELQTFVDAVNGWLEHRCGAVVPRLVTEAAYVAWDGVTLRLPTRPVIAVVSATYAGVATSVAGWSQPDDRGLITVPSGAYPKPSTGAGLVVTYRAGRIPVPAELPLAGKILVQDLWQSQRTQSAAPQSAGFSDQVITVAGRGYFVPRLVAEMVEPYAINDDELVYG